MEKFCVGMDRVSDYTVQKHANGQRGKKFNVSKRITQMLNKTVFIVQKSGVTEILC